MTVAVRVTVLPATTVAGEADSELEDETASYVKVVVVVFPPTVTTTETAPKVPAGVVTVITVEPETESEVPATPPNVTDDAPLSCEPVIVTSVPPVTGPDAGEIAEIVGALADVLVIVNVVEEAFVLPAPSENTSDPTVIVALPSPEPIVNVMV